jgi:hypothetical protein
MEPTDRIQASYAEEVPFNARLAAGIRALIRHKLPGIDPEPILIEVLKTVAATEPDKVRNEKELVAMVRDVLNTAIAKQAPKSPPGTKKSRNHPAIDITDMTAQERGILARFYGIHQSETQIGQEMCTTIEIIREVKRRVRDLNRT